MHYFVLFSMKKTYFLFLIASVLISLSCNDAQLVGSELFDDATIDIEYNDAIHPTLHTLAPDSLRAFSADGSLFRRFQEYMIGETNDPVWGRHKAGLYMTSGIMSASLPEFEGAVVDSLIMVLPLDTFVRYGDTTAVHDINVYRLETFPGSSTVIADRVDTFYTNTIFPYEPTPLGTVSIVPSYFDSLEVYSPSADSIIEVAPQLRIRLDKIFATELLDPEYVTSDSTFQGKVRGFYIESDPSSSSLIGIRNQNLSQSSTTGLLSMYYKDADGVSQIYNFSLGVIKNQYFEHDFSGSEVELSLNGDTSRGYLMGMAGTDIEVDLSELKSLGNVGINFAQLQIVVDPNQEFSAEQPSIAGIFAVYGEKDILVSDIPTGETETVINAVFDGILKEVSINGVSHQVYQINITDHVNKIVKNEISETKIKLISRAKLETPGRMILIGNSGDDTEIVLKMIITRP